MPFKVFYKRPVYRLMRGLEWGVEFDTSPVPARPLPPLPRAITLTYIQDHRSICNCGDVTHDGFRFRNIVTELLWTPTAGFLKEDPVGSPVSHAPGKHSPSDDVGDRTNKILPHDDDDDDIEGVLGVYARSD